MLDFPSGFCAVPAGPLTAKTATVVVDPAVWYVNLDPNDAQDVQRLAFPVGEAARCAVGPQPRSMPRMARCRQLSDVGILDELGAQPAQPLHGCPHTVNMPSRSPY